MTPKDPVAPGVAPVLGVAAPSGVRTAQDIPAPAGSRELLASYWPPYGLRLTSPRLTLTPIADDDLPALVDLALAGIHDPDQMPFGVPWTDAPRAELIVDTLRYHWSARAAVGPASWDMALGVFRDGELVGTQGLTADQFATTRTVSTGSWLGRAHQGNGIGTEMRCAVLQFAFDQLGATRAESAAFVDNPASLRVSEKNGYRPDGTEVHVRRGAAALQQRLLVTPETFRRPAWTVQVVGLDACRPLLGLDPVGPSGGPATTADPEGGGPPG